MSSAAVLVSEFLWQSVRFLTHTNKDHSRPRLSTVNDQTS